MKPGDICWYILDKNRKLLVKIRKMNENGYSSVYTHRGAELRPEFKRIVMTKNLRKLTLEEQQSPIEIGTLINQK